MTICPLLPFLVVLLLTPRPLPEVPPLSPERLETVATDIVVGTVQAVYERAVRNGDYLETTCVAEIIVESVEKGAGEGESRPMYVRYWRRAWKGSGHPPTGSSGHRGVPAEGDRVKVYAARRARAGALSPTHEQDGGLNALLPNGFQIPSE